MPDNGNPVATTGTSKGTGKSTSARHQTSKRARAATLWGLLFFAGFQIALTVTIERWRPMWSDPEYGYRLKHLRQRIAAEPGKPLLVMLGSSRVGNGFEADDLPPSGSRGKGSPIVFNMSLAGGTPVIELFMLHRLLALGIRPNYLVIEVLAPGLLIDANWFAPGASPSDGRLRWSDLDVLRRHAPSNTWKNYLTWFQWNLVPAYSYRYCLVSRYLPTLLEPGNLTSIQVNFWRHAVSPSGWLPFGVPTVTPAQYREWFNNLRTGYEPLYAQFQVSPKVDAVFREMLEVCRRENIAVLGLVLMPDSSDLRGLCPPEKCALIHSYLTGLCREYHTNLIDTTSWISDNYFADGNHLLPAGARLFTDRFWREALQPLLQGRSQGECVASTPMRAVPSR
jgi:hypothetical protein